MVYPFSLKSNWVPRSFSPFYYFWERYIIESNGLYGINLWFYLWVSAKSTFSIESGFDLPFLSWCCTVSWCRRHHGTTPKPAMNPTQPIPPTLLRHRYQHWTDDNPTGRGKCSQRLRDCCLAIDSTSRPNDTTLNIFHPLGNEFF